MLNTFNELKINAVSGTLIKSHPRSRFTRFHINSPYAAKVWDGREKIYPLQFMLCGDGELLMEYVEEKDWTE